VAATASATKERRTARSTNPLEHVLAGCRVGVTCG
jgi:hypothetical protein